jgi:hypothetical protein
MGYAFVRSSDGEHVVRTVDLRGLTEENRLAFEGAALEAARVATELGSTAESSALARLGRMIECARAGAPPLELSDWTTVARPCVAKIGPGWDDG